MKKIILVLFLSFSSMFAFENINLNNFDEKINNQDVIVDFYYSW